MGKISYDKLRKGLMSR